MLFQHHQIIQILQRRWRPIVIGTLFFAALSAGVSFLFPLEYRADAQVLIIQGPGSGVDPYTAIKSAERVGENIVQIMKTDDFFEKVMKRAGTSIDKKRFTDLREQDKRKRWQKSVEASVVYGTGVVNINTYHTDPKQAIALANGIVQTLVNDGADYIGSGVVIKQVNSPVASEWPVRPNIFLNTIAGLLIGLIITVFIVVRRYR